MKTIKKKSLQSYISEKKYCFLETKFKGISNHVDVFVNFLKKNILNQIDHNKLLDIGAGPGFITKKISKYFKSTTIIEINPEYKKYYKLNHFNFLISDFQNVDIKSKYNLILCSHVLYHIESDHRNIFLKKIIDVLGVNGKAVIVMIAPRGKFHELCKSINYSYTNSHQIMNTLDKLGVYYKNYPSTCYYTTTDEEYFINLVKMFVIDDCFTPNEYLKLNKYEKIKIQKKINQFIKNSKNKLGRFKFLTEEDYIIINKE